MKAMTLRLNDAEYERLRRRLMETDPDHRYIYAVRGHGFEFEQPE